MKFIDNFLNRITMYKLVLYGLMLLAGISIIFSLFGLISYSVTSLLSSVVILFITCYFSNYIFAKIFKVQTNVESSAITAVILFFILFPVSSWLDVKMVFLIAVLAMASKYLLAINKKHIFNPAAVAVFIVAIFGSGMGAWWVGSSVMLLPTAILGFLVLRKLRRFQLFFLFVLGSGVSMFIFALINNANLYEVFIASFVSGPILFFGSIMLTEPLTTPPYKKMQIAYGLIVGGLFGSQFHLGSVYSSPELALLIGNIFSFIVSPKDKLVLKLVSKDTINKTGDVDEFRFEADKKLLFKAGQYLEWTLGHPKPDSRGNRRYFTISSSPTEKEIKLGIKYYDDCSSFKMKLGNLEIGDKIYAGSLAGDFTLPDDKNKKLVFIAGGIGATPFRSIVKYLLDKAEKRDIVFFFSSRTPKDIVYKDIFDKAGQDFGMKTIYAVNDLAGEVPLPNMPVGFINEEMIRREVPDFKERSFYISGPHGMVSAFEDTLTKMGIPRSQIKIDFFPGFV